MNKDQGKKIRALVVDDSLFMRALIADMLNADPAIEVVGTANDGLEASKKIPRSRPDVITLDLNMPGWDGLLTLRHIMAEHPTPVVILSAHSKQDAEVTFQCLEAGAVGFVLKPSGELSLDIESVKGQLVEAVKAASRVQAGKIRSLIAQRHEIKKHQVPSSDHLIVMGASTGGPQTLEVILPALPSGFPAPILVAQHVPSRFFTDALAERLNRYCDLPVKIAEDNERVEGGAVYLAPGGYRLRVAGGGLSPTIHAFPSESRVPGQQCRYFQLTEEEPGRGPSIDAAMESAAEVYRERAIGVILSGMGHDGVEGMRAIKKAGGRTIVQDESSLIFGMPKAVIDAGCADHVLPVAGIPETMMAYAEASPRVAGVVIGKSPPAHRQGSGHRSTAVMDVGTRDQECHAPRAKPV